MYPSSAATSTKGSLPLPPLLSFSLTNCRQRRRRRRRKRGKRRKRRTNVSLFSSLSSAFFFFHSFRVGKMGPVKNKGVVWHFFCLSLANFSCLLPHSAGLIVSDSLGGSSSTFFSPPRSLASI